MFDKIINNMKKAVSITLSLSLLAGSFGVCASDRGTVSEKPVSETTKSNKLKNTIKAHPVATSLSALGILSAGVFITLGAKVLHDIYAGNDDSVVLFDVDDSESIYNNIFEVDSEFIDNAQGEFVRMVKGYLIECLSKIPNIVTKYAKIMNKSYEPKTKIRFMTSEEEVEHSGSYVYADEYYISFNKTLLEEKVYFNGDEHGQAEFKWFVAHQMGYIIRQILLDVVYNDTSIPKEIHDDAGKLPEYLDKKLIKDFCGAPSGPKASIGDQYLSTSETEVDKFDVIFADFVCGNGRNGAALALNQQMDQFLQRKDTELGGDDANGAASGGRQPVVDPDKKQSDDDSDDEDVIDLDA